MCDRRKRKQRPVSYISEPGVFSHPCPDHEPKEIVSMIKFTKVNPNPQSVVGWLCVSPPKEPGYVGDVTAGRISIRFFPDEPVIGVDSKGNTNWVKRGDWTWSEKEFETTFGTSCPVNPGDKLKVILDLG